MSCHVFPEFCNDVLVPDKRFPDAILLAKSQRHTAAGTAAADRVKVLAAFQNS
jgi:hypothetical protein